MKFFTKEVKIAIVAIVGLVVLFFGMQFLKGLTFFDTDNNYYISFDDVTGLAESSPIYAKGYKVGVVKKIDFDYNTRSLKAMVTLNHDMRIPKGTTAEIAKDLLGNVSVNLYLANGNEYLQPHDVIPGRMQVGIMNKVEDLMPAIEKIVPKLDSIMDNLNLLLSDPSIARSLHNIEGVTANLTTTSQQLNVLVGGLNRSIPGVIGKANGVLDNTQRLTSNLAAVDVAGTMAQVNQTLSNVQEVTDKINHNKGTLGLLMNDPSLYNNLTSTMRNADSLVVNLRQHPKRYVHFSLFRKKDK